MAILEKRRAVNQLPRFERYQDTRAGDRAAALRGETPITSAIRQLAGSSGYGPMAEAQGFAPMDGGAAVADRRQPTAGGAKIDKFGNIAGQPKTAVTSALKGPSGADKSTQKPITSAVTGAPAKSTKPLPETKTTTKPLAVGPGTKTTGAGGTKTTGLTSTTKQTGTTTRPSKVSDLSIDYSKTASGAGPFVAGPGGVQPSKPLNIPRTPNGEVAWSKDANGNSYVIGSDGQKYGPGPGGIGLIPLSGGTSKTPSLTSTGTGTAGKTTTGTTGKTLTSTGTGTAGKTLTSTGTGTTVGGNTKTTGSTGSTIGKTLTSALTGAAVGAGTKYVIDKLTGGTKTTGGTGGTGGTKGGTGVTSVVKGTGAGGTNVGTPPFVPGGTKTGTGITGTKTGTGTVGPKAPVTSGPKTTGGTGSKTTTGGTGGTKTTGAGAGAGAGVGQGDQTEDTESRDTAVIAYDDEGNLLPGYELDENNNPVWVGVGDQDTVVAGGGEDTVTGGGSTQTLDDGTVVNYDANGNVVSYTDTDGVLYDANGDVVQAGGADTVVDASGNIVTGLGTTTGYDTTDKDADGLFSDDEGNLYDADGNLVQYADGTMADDASDEGSVADVAYTDEYGNEYDAGGNLLYEADHSDYVFTDEYGNQYNWDGELIAEGDNTDNTDTSDEENYDDGTSDEEPPEERKGGLIHMAGGGFNYGKPDTAANYQSQGKLLGADRIQLQNFLDQIPDETDNNADPIDEQENSDGTTTQYFDDGSTITYDGNGEVLYVTDATDNSVSDTNSVGATSNQSSGGQGNRVYYDDGSSVETFDDGSTITYNSDGSVYNTTDAYQTTYDDEGNAIVTDGYGNIVSVYDPQGNVIPLGGGRVTGPTQITGAGGGSRPSITTPTSDEESVINPATESAIQNLLNGLNTYGGAGAAGAVLGALLGNTDLFGGGGGGSGGGIDMSKVGVINPRTTDFGIGPAAFVGYDQYGTPEAMPELYGTELYQNLNAPGFNEVNPGDYARYDEAEFGPSADTRRGRLPMPEDDGVPVPEDFSSGEDYYREPEDFAYGEDYYREPEDSAYGEDYYRDPLYQEDFASEPHMAEGGMPTVPQGGLGQSAPQTYYTFGKPVDPIQNLRNPAPFKPQQPQQGMPPQAAQNASQVPQQMPLPQTGLTPNQPSIPQGTPPSGVGMKSGGLPAWSNVPITNGRLNFRHGAPVHGPGDGQSDDIPAMLADGEYVIDAETVAQIGNGSTKAGAKALDKFRENIRAHKRSAPINKIPPKTKALTSYLKGAK